MDLWQRYTSLVYNNILNRSLTIGSVAESKDRIFVQIIVYFLPLSVIAIIPGVLVSALMELYFLAGLNSAALSIILFIAFHKRVGIIVRKILFITVIYLVAIAIFYYPGSLLYFLMGTFFTALIFPGYNGYWSVAANVVICSFLGLVFHFNLLDTQPADRYTDSSWIAVSLNLILLSILVTVLLPRLFNMLRNSYERFEIVAKATSDTIWDWDIVAHRMRFNIGIRKMFGYEEGEVADYDIWWRERIHPEDQERVVGEFTSFFTGHDPYFETDYRFRCADGSYKCVLNRASAVFNAEGKPVRMIGVLQDVSKIRNYIAAIEEQNRKLREISWIQSHKVRSPVATILGLASLLKSDQAINTDQEQIVDGIRQSCMRLDEVIKEINEHTTT